MSRTFRRHGPDFQRDKRRAARRLKSNKQRRANERSTLRKEYR